MEDWDEEKLADVVGKKHGAEKKLETAIVRFRKFQPKFIYRISLNNVRGH